MVTTVLIENRLGYGSITNSSEITVAHSIWPFEVGWELHVLTVVFAPATRQVTATVLMLLVIVAERKAHTAQLILDLLSQACSPGISKQHI